MENLGNEFWTIDTVENLKCRFYGLSSNIDKLPKNKAIGTGSTAYCIDTSEVYMFFQLNLTWYKQQ